MAAMSSPASASGNARAWDCPSGVSPAPGKAVSSAPVTL